MRGEYWIKPPGDVTFCDGDLVDDNHEAVAMDAARNLIADHLGANADNISYSSNEEFEEVCMGAARKLWREFGGSGKFPKSLTDALRGLSVPDPEGVLDAATGGDSRAYAMRKWGWVAVRDSNVEVWSLDRKTLDVAAKGIETIAEDLGLFDDNGKLTGNMLYHFSEYKGRRYLKISLEQIVERDYKGGTSVAPAGMSYSVAKMDKESEHPYYRLKRPLAGVVPPDFSAGGRGL